MGADILDGKLIGDMSSDQDDAVNQYRKRIFFEENILIHYGSLYFYALKTMQHKEAAEDAVQSTLERAWANLDKLRDEEKAKTWLFTIARNQMYTALGKRKLHKQCDITELIFRRIESETAEPDVLKILIKLEERKNIAEALSRVQEKYRKLLELRYYWGYSEKDIAKIVDMKYSTVRVYIGRALKELHKYYMEIEKGGRD